MIEILFYLTYDTILDMYNLVGFISHTALMSYHYDGHAILLVQLLQQLLRAWTSSNTMLDFLRIPEQILRE